MARPSAWQPLDSRVRSQLVTRILYRDVSSGIPRPINDRGVGGLPEMLSDVGTVYRAQKTGH